MAIFIWVCALTLVVVALSAIGALFLAREVFARWAHRRETIEQERRLAELDMQRVTAQTLQALMNEVRRP